MKPKYTGHDTFPLRYGWLYKSANHLNNNKKLLASNDESTREAIVELGVGKNMVNAMRYWSDCSGTIDLDKQNVTENGAYLFGNAELEGKDPYLEKAGSIWLLHFWLNFNYEYLTAYRYFFNYSSSLHFEKSQLVENLLADERNLFVDESRQIFNNEITDEQRIQAEKHRKTVTKDIDCFLNTYCHKVKKGKKNDQFNEDYFSSPLSELNLLHDNGGGYYISDLGDRPDLPIEIFIYSLIEYAKKGHGETGDKNIKFEDILVDPCSPGRIFRLSEAGLDNKLHKTQIKTKNAISWNSTQGLRQITIKNSLMKSSERFLNEFYGK